MIKKEYSVNLLQVQNISYNQSHPKSPIKVILHNDINLESNKSKIFDNNFLINISKDYYITKIKNKYDKLKIIYPHLSDSDLNYVYYGLIQKDIKYINYRNYTRNMIRNKRFFYIPSNENENSFQFNF